MYFSDSSNKSELIHLKSVRYWHRPGGGIFEVIEKMKEEGITDPTLLDRSYVELYVGSLFAMCLQESEKLDWWISKPTEDPPDMAIMTMMRDARQKLWFCSREVEITRYIQGRKSLIQTILDKDQPYPGNYVIACFLEANGIEYLKKISTQLSGKLKNIRNVFLIFHGMSFSEWEKLSEKKEAISKVTLVQLLPVFDVQVIDIENNLEKWKLDDKRLAYVEDGKVYYGLRRGESTTPKIIF